MTRVAFDVTPVISGRTGIARYVRELAVALETHDVELRRFAVGRSAYPAPPATRHLRVPARLLTRSWDAVGWPPVERFAGRFDLLHETGMLMPATRRPLVVTVHDLAGLSHPELHPDRNVEQQRELVRALPRAAAILAVSSATADDLAHVGIPAERIVVSPLGLTALAAPVPGPGHPASGYLLTVGESSPRKGYPVLIEALSRLEPRPRLVMAGPPAGDETRVRELIGTLGLDGTVTRLGAVSEPALAALYADALALCFPSVSEGFGLPVLEAMAAGLPVLAADIPPVREVVGDAAILLPPGDAGTWAEAIEAVVADPSLRDRLAEEGRRRAAGFTWARTAERTLAAYRLALAATSGPTTS